MNLLLFLSPAARDYYTLTAATQFVFRQIVFPATFWRRPHFYPVKSIKSILGFTLEDATEEVSGVAGIEAQVLELVR
jgi:hypothetical protein